MAKFNSIHSNIWEDEKFRSLGSLNSKLLYIYVFSNHRCPISGIYKISVQTMSFETGIAQDCEANLEEIIRYGLVSYDFKKNAIWVRGKIKHDKSWKSQMRKKSIKRDLAEFSKCSFIQSVTHQYPQLIDLVLEVETEERDLKGCREEVPETPPEAASASETGASADGMHRVS